MREVPNPGETANIPDMKDVDSLLTENKKQYFTYDGSLTTPPCTEAVTWIEFKSWIPMSHKQVMLTLSTKFKSI